MRLIPLGTNGFLPSFGRQTMSFLILTKRNAILLDAGTGLGRLLEPHIQKALLPYQSLDIILSHYHLDHTVGLSYLPGVWSKGKIRIYAPGYPLVEAQPEEALNKLLHPPLFSLPLKEFPIAVEIVPVIESRIEVQGMSIHLRSQKHPGGSVGIRIEDYLAYITDTAVDKAAESFISGVDLLIHEVWLSDAELDRNKEELSGHSFASGVVELASICSVKRLMPVHHHPNRTNEGLIQLAMEMERNNLEITVPKEGETYRVS